VILLLGGTSETAPLAAGMVKAGFAVLVSTATDIPLELDDYPQLRRRSGPLDAPGLEALIRDNAIRVLVDGTHPYAAAIRALAAATAHRLSIPYLTFVRPGITYGDPLEIASVTTSEDPSRPLENAFFCHSGLDHESSNDFKTLDSGLCRNDDRETEMEFFQGLASGIEVTPEPRSEIASVTVSETDGITFAADHNKAARLACAVGKAVLLTTGSRNLRPYAEEAKRTGVPLIVRVLPHHDSLAACRAAGIPAEMVIAAKGPFSVEENINAIRKFGVGVLVTKDSGIAGGVPAKIAAAGREKCMVIVVERPFPGNGLMFQSVEKLIKYLEMNKHMR
jgi:precorrin-6x reductase